MPSLSQKQERWDPPWVVPSVWGTAQSHQQPYQLLLPNAHTLLQHLQVWPTQQLPMGSAFPPQHPAPQCWAVRPSACLLLWNHPGVNRSDCCLRLAPRKPNLRSPRMCTQSHRLLLFQPRPFPVTLTISNVWEILNLRHLKSQGAHLAPKSSFQRWEIGAQGGTVTSPRLLGVSVKGQLHPSLCSPSPVPIHSVTLAQLGIWTSWPAGL